MRAARWMLSLCSALYGCSAIVGELDLHCEVPSDCDALNEKYRLDPRGDCFIYQCRSDGRGCEKRAQDLDGDGSPAPVCVGLVAEEPDCDDLDDDSAPGLSERCDGIDNDCDQLVDEALFGETPLTSEAVATRPVLHVSHGYSAQRGLMLALTSSDRDKRATSLWKLNAPSAEPQAKAQIVRSGSLSSVCSEPLGSNDCNFDEVVLGVQDELMLGLGVNVAGCSDGQLRVGLDGMVAARIGAPESARGQSASEQEIAFTWDDDTLAQRASQAAKNLSTGIDRGAESTCSRSGEHYGASAPSLAILSNGPTSWQSLALWRSGPANTPAPLVGLALWLEDGLIADASGGGHAEALDLAPGRDPASVQAWKGARESGYFIAYDADDSVQLAFVPTLRSASRPLAQDARRAQVASAAGARHPALAVQTGASEGPRGLAVAWRQGAPDRTVVHFSEISLLSDTEGDAFLVGAPIELSEPRAIVDGPVLVHATSGFASSAEKSGGWLVAWLERDGAEYSVVAVRVAELTGARVEPPFALYRGPGLAHLFAYAAEGSPAGYGFVTEETSPSGSRSVALNIGSLSCRD